MFESILADILNRYLKPYVKKLDTSQLRLGIWKGKQYHGPPIVCTLQLLNAHRRCLLGELGAKGGHFCMLFVYV